MILIASWLPLLVYVLFDVLRGGGGNPIGLGLLAMGGTALCGVLILIQIVVRAFADRSSE